MKKILVVFGFAAILAFAISLSAADSQTWTGWLSDSGCAAKGMSADHKSCALSCVHDKGAKWVFVNSEDKKVLPIHNQDAVKDSDVGMEVKLTGSLMDDGAVHVESIAPAKM